MELIIRRPKSPEEFRIIMDIMKDAWGMADYTEAVPAHFLRSIDDNGGLVLIAYDRDTPVGFTLGILARSDSRLYLYSHMTGVVSKYKYKGVGFKLKLAQRQWAIEQGLDLVKWTFDPLQGLNAYFNFNKLGVVCNTYYRNFYGEIRDGINRGLITDRFKVDWWIKSKRVELKVKGLLKPPSFNEVRNLGEVANVTEEIAGGVRKISEIKLDIDSEVVFVEIPGELSKVRDYSLDLANDWRLRTRQIFETYFAKGYYAIELISEKEDEIRRNFYVLWRRDLKDILNGKVPWIG
ncbi:MAG: hypothetical protein B6U94_07295 [Thermofilum sp. ex4484_79]|nr:MAG: hypothetical protein B6U94_07295 [Thermofilum sp. ex4484_79]HDD64478.1 hypothetical protein [Thermoprotei archaeon]